MDSFIHLVIYVVSFVFIWIGAGFALRSVEQLSRALRLSSFAVSFLILGFFTSVSEFSVGINSIFNNEPEIYIGNLIGASIVIFLLIVPLLAITGSGLKINKELQGFNLLLSIIVISTPVILSMDGKVDRIDSLIAMILYFFLVFCIQLKKGILEHVHPVSKRQTYKLLKYLLTIVIGLVIIFVSSKVVVDQTQYFSEILGVSPFLISLLFISVGTNIPELSFVVRSVFMKSKQVAFGDYVGSSAFNTFLFGLLTLINGETVYLTNSYLVSLFFLTSGLLVFYLLVKSDHFVSRTGGFMLVMIYFVFLLVEFIIHI